MQAITEQPARSTASAGRHDVYAAIHKALRLFMTDTMTLVGAVDPRDDVEVDAAIAQVRALLEALAGHIDHEHHFVHPAIDAVIAGASRAITDDHVEHRQSIADLHDLCGLVEDTRGAPRRHALTRLYLELSRFVGDNLVHLFVEQTEHNRVLWLHYDDEALQALEGRIAATIEPVEMTRMLRWFVPALNAPERAAMIDGIRGAMPPQALDIVLDLARDHLRAGQHARLLADLGFKRAA